MNWTGLGIAFPREDWSKIKERAEFTRAGVYILIGRITDDDLPTIYIGQSDLIRDRVDHHVANKEFWSAAVVFASTASGGLNRAHATWLEHALIQRAHQINQSHIENGTKPPAPQLSEAERADTQAFLREMLQILPLIGLTCFEPPKTVAAPMAHTSSAVTPTTANGDIDTVIVPAQKEGFEKVFLGENAWHAIRISGGMIPKIKYIAAYQSQPVSAITHLAPVASIEPYGDNGKYKLIFSEPAKPSNPIPFGNAPSGAMQGPCYTTHSKLFLAKNVSDVLIKD